jgi:hypothetical protein
MAIMSYVFRPNIIHGGEDDTRQVKEATISNLLVKVSRGYNAFKILACDMF